MLLKPVSLQYERRIRPIQMILEHREVYRRRDLVQQYEGLTAIIGTFCWNWLDFLLRQKNRYGIVLYYNLQYPAFYCYQFFWGMFNIQGISKSVLSLVHIAALQPFLEID